MPRLSPYYEDPYLPPGRGGPPRGWRAIFRQGDNPMTWALPMGRYFGIEVRLGLLFIVFIVFELANAAMRGGFQPKALMLSTLFFFVLLHEFGHCFACRRVGGQADEILLWPLGGLASCRPPHTWYANFVTTAGGPLVNVALVPIIGGAILLTGGSWDALVFNPFNPGAAWASYADGFWKSWLWWAYFSNWMLLAFNVLVPAFPMDGGRLLQAILWRKMGFRRATELACRVGLFFALAMFIFGIVTGSGTLLGIAVFGGLTCYQELQRLRFTGGVGGVVDEVEESPYAASLKLVRDDEDQWAVAARKKEADDEAREREEEDRILAKIAKTGLDSLSYREQNFLKQATQKRRARSDT